MRVLRIFSLCVFVAVVSSALTLWAVRTYGLHLEGEEYRTQNERYIKWPSPFELNELITDENGDETPDGWLITAAYNTELSAEFTVIDNLQGSGKDVSFASLIRSDFAPESEVMVVAADYENPDLPDVWSCRFQHLGIAYYDHNRDGIWDQYVQSIEGDSVAWIWYGDQWVKQSVMDENDHRAYLPGIDGEVIYEDGKWRQEPY